MCSPKEAGPPLTLVIQRLMDADLLHPEEGAALLEEVATSGCASGEAQRPTRQLEALLKADHLNASVAQQAKAIVHQILNVEPDPA